MDESSLNGLVEMIAVFGTALGFGIWQMVSIRRELRRSKEKEAKERDGG